MTDLGELQVETAATRAAWHDQWTTGAYGPLPLPEPGVIILPGCIRHTVRQDDKHHQTGKPTPLMRDLVKLCPPGGVIFDGYAGSGTTAAAALMEGRRVIAVERSEEYHRVALERCRAAAEGRRPDVRFGDGVLDTSSPVRVEAGDSGPLFAGGAR